MFATLFDQHNNKHYDFALTPVTSSPNGPRQDVGKHETLCVLNVLNMRCTLFKVALKTIEEATEAENTKKQSSGDLQARKRQLSKQYDSLFMSLFFAGVL